MRPSGRPKTLILDIYGAYARRLGGWLAVADLVSLMGTLGIDEQAVRSAVSRMTRRGLLRKERRARVTGYSLTAEAEEAMAKGDRRIFTTTEPAELADGWVLVSFSVPESEREKRYVLRSRLAWLGFGNLAGGVWIAPRRALKDLRDTVRKLGIEECMDVFDAHYRGFDELEGLVRRAWDLSEMAALYADFLSACRPLVRRWKSADPDADPERAFVDYTLTLHRWRKLPFLDPGLPEELLPPKWEGREAAEAFFALRDRLEGAAMRYVERVVRPPLHASGIPRRGAAR